MQMTSAYNPFKWILCDAGNMTGGLCDDYWENFKQLMGISDTANKTSDINWTEFEKRLQYYYNETEMNQIINELNKSILENNKSIQEKTFNMSLVNLAIKECLTDQQKCLNLDSERDEFITSRDLDNIATSDTGEEPKDNTLLILGGIFILVVSGMAMFIFKDKIASRAGARSDSDYDPVGKVSEQDHPQNKNKLSNRIKEEGE